MALPNMTVPRFNLELPISNKKVIYRPFLVKEEKLLLIAKEGGDEESIQNVVEQIIDNCVEGISAKELPTVEIEYLFLNIRAKSVGEEVELRYRHSGDVNRDGQPCDTSTPVLVNLEEVKIVFDDRHTDKIMLTEDVGVQMKYPSFGDTETLLNNAKKDVVSLIADCIEFIFDKETIYDDTITTHDEKLQFVNNLSQEQL